MDSFFAKLLAKIFNRLLIKVSFTVVYETISFTCRRFFIRRICTPGVYIRELGVMPRKTPEFKNLTQQMKIFEMKATTQIAHLVFADTQKTDPKKPKELFFSQGHVQIKA